MILDIVIHQCNDDYGSAPSEGWFFKVILAIIGPLIAVALGIYLYNKKATDDKDKEDSVKINDNNDLLNYFTAIAINVVKNYSDQAKLLKDFADKKKADPYNPSNSLRVNLKRDIERLDTLDQAKIFKAYYVRLGHNQLRLNELTQMYSCLDYLFDMKDNLIDTIEQDHKLTFGLMSQFGELSTTAQMNASELLGKGKNGKLPQTQEYQDMWNGVNAIFLTYFRCMDNGVVTLPQVKTLLIDRLKVLLIENYSHLPESNIILKSCKKTGDKYKEIEVYQTGIAERFTRIYDNISETVATLTGLIPAIVFPI